MYIKKYFFKIKTPLILVILFVPFFLFIHSHLYQRIGAFDCFDDCNTIISGYFMTLGKSLYTDIFYNHQPLMSSVSYALQLIISTETLYSLISLHRLFIYGFSLLMGFLLIIRFRTVGLYFLLLYEPIKYYLFGDRFLPESLIPYLTAYLIGIIWIKFTKHKVLTFDYYSAVLFSWAIIFLREPYIPLALWLLGMLFFEKNIHIIKWRYLIGFVLIIIVTILVLPINDYIDAVFILNSSIASKELQSNNVFGTGLSQLLFYPLYIFTLYSPTFLGKIQLLLSSLFIVLSFIVAIKYRNKLLVLTIWITLALAAIRIEDPGKMFYEAFHMLVWHGALIMGIAILTQTVLAINRKLFIKIGLYTIIISISVFSLFYKESFIYEKIDTITEFNNSYARYESFGAIIDALSNKEDTLYVELWDDILYWRTKLNSSYPFSIYTPWNQSTVKYQLARSEMFLITPPDIYYCSENYLYNEEEQMPQYIKEAYVQLTRDDKPVCVYLHISKFNTISEEKWHQLQKSGIFYETDAAYGENL